MEKRYIIKESLLLDLLAESGYAEALEAEGVDNWSWYGEAIHQALGKQYESFDDLAKDDLKKYIDNNEIIDI
jgi:predicted phosphoribosyltransferase